jgi:hypothetical protein
VRDIFAGVELELKPLGLRLAKASSRVAAKGGLNCARKPYVEEVFSMQMGELAPGDGPRGAPLRSEAGRGLLYAWKTCKGGAKLFDGPHSTRA